MAILYERPFLSSFYPDTVLSRPRNLYRENECSSNSHPTPQPFLSLPPGSNRADAFKHLEKTVKKKKSALPRIKPIFTRLPAIERVRRSNLGMAVKREPKYFNAGARDFFPVLSGSC